MATPVEIALRATGTSAVNAALGRVDSTSSRLGRTLKTAAKAGALALGAGAVYGAKKLVDFTQAAIEDEAAQKRLATTLKNTTGATDKQVAGVEKWITQQGKLLGVTDDELRPALQRMAEGTGSVTKAQKMVKLAMDASAGTGKSLKSVTEALLRAQNGSVGGLSRYGIATKNAKGETLSLSKVLDGMAKKFGGQAATQAATLEGKMQRLKVMFSEAGEELGSELIPYVTKAADYLLPRLSSAIEDGSRWLNRNKGEIRDTAVALKDGLIPPLKTAAGVVADVAGFFSDLPGPVQEFGAQAAAAALILPRLSGALTATQARVTAFSTSVRAAETRTRALGGAARMAAGIGGVLALSKASKETNKALSATENVLGGVAIGFSMGGPIGALIGLFGGVTKAAWDLTDPTEELAAANRELGRTYSGVKSKAGNYADTLDQVTGAITRQTKAEALQRAEAEGVLPLLNRLGVNSRDVVGAIVGQEGATKRLNRALATHRNTLTGLEELKVNEFLGIQTRGFAKQQNQVRETNSALTGWKKALKGLPPAVRTKVQAIGTDISARELKRLKKQYDLTPKQVKTIVAAIGTERTIRQVRGVWQVFEDGKRVRPNLNPWENDLANSLGRGKRTVDKGVGDVNRLLFAGTGKARANLSPFNSSLSSGISAGRARASSGGSGIGASLAAGVASGIASNAWQAVNAAAAMVADATVPTPIRRRGRRAGLAATWRTV